MNSFPPGREAGLTIRARRGFYEGASAMHASW